MATFAGLGANGTVTTAVNNSRNGVVVVRAETEETAVPEGEPEEKVQDSDSPQQKGGVIFEEGNEAFYAALV